MPKFILNQPDLTTEQALRLLETGDIQEIHGLLPWGSNYTFLVQVSDGKLTAIAVYKPRAGEQPLWDFPDGTLYLRERAAFTVSQALGWGIVPATVLRDGPKGPGSLQYFVPHDPDYNYFTLGDHFRPQLRRIALFDEIVNNADRKGGHCLLDKHGRLWAIDHGVCFSPHPKLRTVIWDFSGEKIPPHLLTDLSKLCGMLEEKQPLRCELDTLLDTREIAALQRRTTRLLETRTFSKPSSGRSYPWPPV